MTTYGHSDRPLVTVLTPAYNVAKYIGESVDSVLRQTFTDFEYLVIDDGSQDNTVDVIHAHSKNDLRVRVILGDHRGPSAARNRGLEAARGDYIAFLDGDDTWHRKFLEKQISLLNSLPSDVGAIFCRSKVMLENGTPVFFQRQRSGRYDFDDFLINNNPARNGSSLVVRKTCFEDVGGFNETIRSVADMEMWLRIAEKSSTPIFWGSRHYLVNLRLRPGSVTRDRRSTDTSLKQLLEWQTSKLRHSAVGAAYVRPALTAMKYGSDEDIAEELVAKAMSVGFTTLIRSIAGLRLLFWTTLPRPGRRTVRAAQRWVREAVKRINIWVRGNG